MQDKELSIRWVRNYHKNFVEYFNIPLNSFLHYQIKHYIMNKHNR